MTVCPNDYVMVVNSMKDSIKQKETNNDIQVPVSQGIYEILNRFEADELLLKNKEKKPSSLKKSLKKARGREEAQEIDQVFEDLRNAS